MSDYQAKTSLAAAIAADKAITEAATPGPWTSWEIGLGTAFVRAGYDDTGMDITGGGLADGDCEFIAASRERLPAYIAAVEAIQALLDSGALIFSDRDLRQALAVLEEL